MILIIGGAYQGKLDYAKTTYQLKEEEILDCSQLKTTGEADLKKRCIYHYETYVELCVKEGITPQTQYEEGKIIITDDVFCGVVPIDTHLRAWREACGRAVTALAQQAQSVIRVFCGIPLKLK